MVWIVAWIRALPSMVWMMTCLYELAAGYDDGIIRLGNILQFYKKLLHFTIVSVQLLCCCGCIDRFWSGSLDFQDLQAPEELPLGKLEKPWENKGVGWQNFRPYNRGVRGYGSYLCSFYRLLYIRLYTSRPTYKAHAHKALYI